MAADASLSLGVCIAGVVIMLTGWLWVDPVVSLVLSAVIVAGTWSLLRDSVSLALDGVPRTVDPHAVGGYLRALPGVAEVHDLHIWAMSTTETAMTVHLVRADLGWRSRAAAADHLRSAGPFRHRPCYDSTGDAGDRGPVRAAA